MTLRIGVAGVGFGTSVHVPALQSEGLEVVAICARRRERAEEAADRLGVGAVFTDYEEMLTLPGLDAVSIATPVALHTPMALAAISAGKHVICEKPVGLDAAQARLLMEAAAASPVTTMVAHEFRYASGRARVKELLDEGYIGNPELALVRLLQGASRPPFVDAPEFDTTRDEAATGGGLLGALGVHYIDGLRHWFGEVATVDGRLLTNMPERTRDGAVVQADVDDGFIFTLTFQSGTVAEVVVNRHAQFVQDYSIAVFGSAGTIVTPQQNFNAIPHGIVLAGRLGVDESLQELEIPDRLEPFEDDRGHWMFPFRMLVRDFLKGVEEGRSPSPNFVDGYRNQLIMDALRASSATGQRVTLTD